MLKGAKVASTWGLSDFQDTLNYHMQQRKIISTLSHTYGLVLPDYTDKQVTTRS